MYSLGKSLWNKLSNGKIRYGWKFPEFMSILTNKEIGIEKYSLLKIFTEYEKVSLVSRKQCKVKSAENSITLYN